MIETQRLSSLALGKVLAGRNLSLTLSSVWSRHPGLTTQQRAAIQDLSYGTLRYYGLLQAMLDHLLDKPINDDSLRCLLLVCLYQLQHSKAAPYAVVDQAVQTAQKLGKARAKGLVNAVLRNFLRRREQLSLDVASQETARYSHPQWWIDKLKQQYPEAWDSILQEGNRHPPMTLRVNARRCEAEEYLGLLQEQGMEATRCGATAIMLGHPLPVDKVPGFSDGLVSVQDAGAQFAASFLDIRAGMKVLDACAAPGGKTSHLLETHDIELTALDNDEVRLERVAQNLQRLKLQATLKLGDASCPDIWWDGQPFDRILADVPCSASGVVRRHPDIKWLRRPADIAQFAGQQSAILDALWRCLARGGKLLYLTCSLFAEENQQQIEAFLRRNPHAAPIPLPTQATFDLQLLPDNNHDGFYFALLAKN